MREKVRPKLQLLLNRKEIHRSKSTVNTVAEELDSATFDLETARESLNNHSYKWATIQASHSMLHAARALLYRMGYRERTQNGLLEALHQLYEREIIAEMLEDFSRTMTLADQLHDGRTSSENSARASLEKATDFLEQGARILAAPREWFERPAPYLTRTKKKKR